MLLNLTRNTRNQPVHRETVRQRARVGFARRQPRLTMGRSKVSDTVFRRCRLQWAILSRPACINIVIGGASSRRFARRSLCCCRSLIMAADRARCSVRAHARSHGGGAARRVDRVRRRDVLLGARDSDRAGIFGVCDTTLKNLKSPPSLFVGSSG